jgi:hypothetical protein
MLSRSQTPINRDRFQAVYHAVRDVRVERIVLIEAEQLPAPAYLVISAVQFDPQKGVGTRLSDRDFGILVFREADEWRFVPAPPQLQPSHKPPPGESDLGPPATQPSYPWDEGGDY